MVQPPGGGRLLGRDFILLWQGQLVSQLGNQAFLVATMAWMLDATGSARLMGLLLMAFTIPAVLIGPLAGAIADRHPRRRIIVFSDLSRAAGHVGLAAVMMALPAATSGIVALLMTLGVASGALGALLTPALAAALPDLVPRGRLAAANSLHHLSTQACTLVGQALGGVAYTAMGAPALILIDGLTFLVSAGCALLARVPHHGGAGSGVVRVEPGHYARDAREGFAWLWQRRHLRSVVMTFAGVNFLFAPVFVLLPIYVRDALREGTEWYGFLLSAAAAGAMAGAGLAPRVGLGQRSFTWAVVGIGGAIAALGANCVPALALALLFVVGILSGILNVQVLTFLQTSTPSELRGRVLGFVMTLAGAAAPVGLGLGGVFGDLLRARLEYVISGCGAAIAILAVAHQVHRRQAPRREAP